MGNLDGHRAKFRVLEGCWTMNGDDGEENGAGHQEWQAVVALKSRSLAVERLY